VQYLLVGTILVLILRVPLRMLGRWLERKGRDIERNRRDGKRGEDLP
jgi:hypothetical protein